MWRAPQGLQGLDGLRDDAPSAARGAGGERAGRPCGARNKGDAARGQAVIVSRAASYDRDLATAHGHRSQASAAMR